MLLMGLIIFFISFYGLYYQKLPTKFTDTMYMCGIALSIALLLIWLLDLILQQGAV